MRRRHRVRRDVADHPREAGLLLQKRPDLPRRRPARRRYLLLSVVNREGPGVVRPIVQAEHLVDLDFTALALLLPELALLFRRANDRTTCLEPKSVPVEIGPHVFAEALVVQERRPGML